MRYLIFAHKMLTRYHLYSTGKIFWDFELCTDQELHDSVDIALGEVLHVGVERLPVGSVVVRACHSYSAVAGALCVTTREVVLSRV